MIFLPSQETIRNGDTHYETRRIIKSLDTYVKSGVLFTFLAPDLDVSHTLASTTNPLEGGINTPLKGFLHAHRDWPEHRMLTAIDYWLYNRSIDPQPLETFVNNTIAQPQTQPVQKEQTGPVEIDNHIDHEQPWEDSLTIRKGWIRH